MKRKGTDKIKILVVVGLVLVTFGLIIYSSSVGYERIEHDEEGAYFDLIGTLLIEIGIMLSSIMLISFALFKKEYDVTIRYGCLFSCVCNYSLSNDYISMRN